MTFYFAYGSNMDGAQMRARVPGAREIGPGTLAGHEFLFSGFSQRWRGAVANVRSKRGATVFGVVYELPVGGLSALDRFEGYPTHYQRKTALVTLAHSRQRVKCALYYKRQTAAEAPPSPAYLAQILRALKRHGAP